MTTEIAEGRAELRVGENDPVGVEAVVAAPHPQREFERPDQRQEEIDEPEGQRHPGPEAIALHLHPPFGAGPHPDVEHVGDAGDDDHAEGERIAQMRILQHVAADLREQEDRHDDKRRAGQRIGGRDRAEGVGEEKREGARAASASRIGRATMRQYWKPARAEDLGGLAPFALQPVERRRDDQDHQRDLEEQIGQGQTPEAQEVEAHRVDVDAEPVPQQHRDQTEPAERGEKGEGQRHAGEVRRDAGEGHHRRRGASSAARPASPPRRRRSRSGSRRSAEASADPDRDPEGGEDRRLEQVGDVGEREARRPDCGTRPRRCASVGRIRNSSAKSRERHHARATPRTGRCGYGGARNAACWPPGRSGVPALGGTPAARS